MSVLFAAVAAVSMTEADTGDELEMYSEGITPCPERTGELDPTPIGTGIAFDGEALYLSCWGSNVLQRVNASDGTVLEPLTITGLDVGGDIAAMSWDSTRKEIWTCSFGRVFLIDVDTQTATLQFSLAGIGGENCFDALAYDATDDTLWAGCDQCGDIAHLTSEGALIELIARPDLGAPNSGIVRAGEHFYAANDGGFSIFQCSLGFETCTKVVESAGDKFEDLECDDVTFAPKVVVWSQNAFERELHAWEVDEPACVVTAQQEQTPTATNTVEATATNTVEPTATNTVEPTATSTSEATATNTPVTPTATNTPVTPTATHTSVPPTATSTRISQTAGVVATPTVQRVSAAAGAVQRPAVRQLPSTGTGSQHDGLVDWLADFALAASATGVVALVALELRRRAAGG